MLQGSYNIGIILISKKVTQGCGRLVTQLVFFPGLSVDLAQATPDGNDFGRVMKFPGAMTSPECLEIPLGYYYRFVLFHLSL